MQRVPTARFLGLIAIVLLGVLAIACVSRDVPAGDPPEAPEPAAAVSSDEVAAADPPDAATPAATAPAPGASEEEDSDIAAVADAGADDPTSEEDVADAVPEDPPSEDPPPEDPPSEDAPPDDPPDNAVADDAPEEVVEAEAGVAGADSETDAGPADDTTADESAADDTVADETAVDVAAADDTPADDTPADDAEADATAEDEAGAQEEAPVVSAGAAVTPAAPDSPALAAEPPEVVVEPRRPLVVLDAGHGGNETGASAFGVVERESNLEFALRVESLLQEAGFDVLLTRRTRDRTRDISDEYPDAPDFVVNRPDLQARVDLANEAGADLFVSIHSNGANDPRASGVEVYWNGQRPHAAANERLALALQESILGSLRSMAGYRAWDRGIREDSCWETSRWTGECSALFLLGPSTEITRERVVALALNPEALGFAPGQDVLRSRATQMPAALLELLFITNEWEAGVLKNEIARQAIAAGIVQGIERYFAETAALADGDAAGAS